MSAKETNPKAAFGDMKVKLHLMPPIATLYTTLVLQGEPGLGGAATYGIYNWRRQSIHYTTYIAAIKRHTLAIECGQDIDPKSKLPHAAHISACTAIIMDAQACNMLVDDRAAFGGKAIELLDARTASSYSKKRAKVKPANCITVAELGKLSTAVAKRMLAEHGAA